MRQPSQPLDVDSRSADDSNEFARQAETSQPNQLQEILAFIKHERKWFLTPIILILLLAGLFVVLSGTAVAPFIYTMF